ncbi:MAG TPA: Uma2 family endonuclease [Kofleriaceae bacterium]
MDKGLLTRREYDQLVARGVFEGAPVELLRGQIVVMSPQGEWHAELTEWLGSELVLALGREYRVRQHSPFAAGRRSEPEPDIAVSVRVGRKPSHPNRALLLVEVAESSLARDRGIKAAIYAENGAAEYWIVDVEARCVWVHTQPIGNMYTRVAKLTRRNKLVPTQLPGISISIADMFALR